MGAGTSPADPSCVDAASAGDGASGGTGGGAPGGGGTGGGAPGKDDGDDARAGDAAKAGAAVDETDGADEDPTGRPDAERDAAESSRRFPSLTRDTARPEGGGRAAPGDAPAPARQWPLLTVFCTAGAGLVIVAANSFDQAFRVGAMLMGIALLAGAVLRWVVPSVGMLAVRSRFTDLVTYATMGTLMVLLALMAQPEPWLDVPVLQDVVHFTIR
jgi:hypothetical protein